MDVVLSDAARLGLLELSIQLEARYREQKPVCTLAAVEDATILHER
jgi:hypothetical protein